MSACTTEEPLNPKMAQAILVRAWQSEQHIVWEMEWSAVPTGGPLTIESWRTDERYRFEVLESTAPALVGETLIFDGQNGWHYNRFVASELPIIPSSPWLSPISDAFAIIERLIATPPDTATRTLVHLNQGLAQKITLTFNHGDRLAIWIDQKMQLPVRIVFRVGEQEALLKARSFEPLINPPRGLFELEH